MKTLPRWLVLLLVFAQSVTLPAWADPPPGKGRGNSPGKGPAPGANAELDLDDVVESLLVAGVTQAYIRSLALNQGLVGYKPLPPGIQMNLMRGKPLPRGIARKLAPPSLLAQLPQYRGYDWMVVGTHLILVRTASETVAEIMSQVFQ